MGLLGRFGGILAHLGGFGGLPGPSWKPSCGFGTHWRAPGTCLGAGRASGRRGGARAWTPAGRIYRFAAMEQRVPTHTVLQFRFQKCGAQALPGYSLEAKSTRVSIVAVVAVVAAAAAIMATTAATTHAPPGRPSAASSSLGGGHPGGARFISPSLGSGASPPRRGKAVTGGGALAGRVLTTSLLLTFLLVLLHLHQSRSAQIYTKDSKGADT